MNCQKDHSDIDSIIQDLPLDQGGWGRHKCAGCAYKHGVEMGKAKKNINLELIMDNLPYSQAGVQRHKSALIAFCYGYVKGRKLTLS